MAAPLESGAFPGNLAPIVHPVFGTETWTILYSFCEMPYSGPTAA